MNRHQIVETIGSEYHRANIEEDEWSYAKDAGTLGDLAQALGGNKPLHFQLDRRFILEDDTGTYAVLVETKQHFVKDDENQLRAYVEEEYALHRGTKVIAILANTNDDRIRVWKSEVDDDHLLSNETVLDDMSHYRHLFSIERQNNREEVMRNTYALNELLHRKGVKERNRSQFVGTCLLYVKDEVSKRCHGGRITKQMNENLCNRWNQFSAKQMREGISEVLGNLLDGSKNKTKKIQLLNRDVLDDQHVRSLSISDWVEILSFVLMRIYRYIDSDSSEGQDILNLFFITFNKYVGKADKNQAFTPDHITDFMTKLTEVTFKDVVLDECCGSGSFLVQAMVTELAAARRGHTDKEYKKLADSIKQKHIFGIESEEKAYGLSTTNMLIHGDGNSNVEFGSCFAKRDFIAEAHPTVILMNPPYNALPKDIPTEYKSDWNAKEKSGKSEPTKGFVFVKYLSDIAKEEDWDGVRLAVLLPMSAAIGTGNRLSGMKEALLRDNTLEAVFSLPAEIFYPGASVQACCMLFTLNRSHYDAEGVPRKKTFFGYYKNDGFIKRKNLGRVEQFDADGHSLWKAIEKEWLTLYRNKTVTIGLSAMKNVTGTDEWLAEAYMETDYSTLTEADFRHTINDYLSYLVKSGHIHENAPNWEWMGNYIKALCSELSNHSHRSSAPVLRIDDWARFKVSDVFTIRNGAGITQDEIDEHPGSFPAVQSGENDNGVMGLIDESYVHQCDYTYAQQPCLTVARSGTAGCVHYFGSGCVVGDSAKILQLKEKQGGYVHLFLHTILSHLRYKYSYGRKVTEGKYGDEIIWLPVTHEGKPDWRAMEQYIKALSEQ